MQYLEEKCGNVKDWCWFTDVSSYVKLYFDIMIQRCFVFGRRLLSFTVSNSVLCAMSREVELSKVTFLGMQNIWIVWILVCSADFSFRKRGIKEFVVNFASKWNKAQHHIRNANWIRFWRIYWVKCLWKIAE